MPASVAELCQRLGISFDELVQRTGMDDNKLRAIVLSRWTPSPEDRQKVADALGVDKDQIRWGHSTPIQHIYGHGPG